MGRLVTLTRKYNGRQKLFMEDGDYVSRVGKLKNSPHRPLSVEFDFQPIRRLGSRGVYPQGQMVAGRLCGGTLSTK